MRKKKEESARQVAEFNGKKTGGLSGCAVTAISAGIGVAGAIAALKGWV